MPGWAGLAGLLLAAVSCVSQPAVEEQYAGVCHVPGASPVDAQSVRAFLADALPAALPGVIELRPPQRQSYYFAPKAGMAVEPAAGYRRLHEWRDVPSSQLLFAPTPTPSPAEGGGTDPSRPSVPVPATSPTPSLFYSSTALTRLPRALRDYLNASLVPAATQGEWDWEDGHGGLWLSSPGLWSTLHFDVSANVLHQLAGTKRVTLLSPRWWREAHQFSALHPAARQSQLPRLTLAAADEEAGGACGDSSAFPDLAALRRRDPAVVQQVVLQPGDHVTIPPLHLHQVEVVGPEPSVSVNVYQRAEHKYTLSELFAQTAPHLVMWKRVRRLLARRGYGGEGPSAVHARAMLHVLHAELVGRVRCLPLDLPQLAADVLATRWSHLDADPFFDRANEAFPSRLAAANCPSDAAAEAASWFRDEEDEDEKVTAFEALAAAVCKLHEQVPDATEMLLADWVETLVSRVFGAKWVRAALNEWAVLADANTPTPPRDQR